MDFSSSNRAAASAKPNIGESSNASPTSFAFPQSTPDVPPRPCSSALAMPTPMIEPIRVCELDAGSPNDQVPRFQMIAAIRSAKTMAKPALAADLQDQLDGKQRNDAEGDRARGGENAGEVAHAGPDHRDVRRQRARVDDGRHGVRGIVEAVDEFEAERDQQRDEEEQERQVVRDLCAGLIDVGIDAVGNEQQDGRNDAAENNAGYRVDGAAEVRSLAARVRSSRVTQCRSWTPRRSEPNSAHRL